MCVHACMRVCVHACLGEGRVGGITQTNALELQIQCMYLPGPLKNTYNYQ